MKVWIDYTATIKSRTLRRTAVELDGEQTDNLVRLFEFGMDDLMECGDEKDTAMYRQLIEKVCGELGVKPEDVDLRYEGMMYTDTDGTTQNVEYDEIAKEELYEKLREQGAERAQYEPWKGETA